MINMTTNVVPGFWYCKTLFFIEVRHSNELFDPALLVVIIIMVVIVVTVTTTFVYRTI